MTDETRNESRDQAAVREDAAPATAETEIMGQTAPQRTVDAVALSEGAVRNGGAYRGGARPDDAVDASDEAERPLDSRTNFGGDGADYVDPSIGSEPDHASRATGRTAGDDGYDPAASRGVDQDAG